MTCEAPDAGRRAGGKSGQAGSSGRARARFATVVRGRIATSASNASAMANADPPQCGRRGRAGIPDGTRRTRAPCGTDHPHPSPLECYGISVAFFGRNFVRSRVALAGHAPPAGERHRHARTSASQRRGRSSGAEHGGKERLGVGTALRGIGLKADLGRHHGVGAAPSGGDGRQCSGDGVGGAFGEDPVDRGAKRFGVEGGELGNQQDVDDPSDASWAGRPRSDGSARAASQRGGARAAPRARGARRFRRSRAGRGPAARRRRPGRLDRRRRRWPASRTRGRPPWPRRESAHRPRGRRRRRRRLARRRTRRSRRGRSQRRRRVLQSPPRVPRRSRGRRRGLSASVPPGATRGQAALEHPAIWSGVAEAGEQPREGDDLARASRGRPTRPCGGVESCLERGAKRGRGGVAHRSAKRRSSARRVVAGQPLAAARSRAGVVSARSSAWLIAASTCSG